VKPPTASPAGGSRFLPDHFDASRPVAVIAGCGLYPQITVQALRQAGRPVRLIAFEGETAPELVDSFPENERATILVGQVGHMLKALRKLGAASAIMAGQIRPRRLFHGLHPDLKALALLATLKERNAATIFGALAREIEAIGVRLLDARAFLDHELASPGIMTGGRQQVDAHTLAFGIRIAHEVARLDIGQSVVVSGGTVVAVEAFEGTDAMLRRAGELETEHPLLVKTSKPGHDYRFDVPVFGRATLAVMREAKISAAALQTDCTLILEKDAVLAEARAAGIQLLGYSAG
jgi:DUF1009 family protein